MAANSSSPIFIPLQRRQRKVIFFSTSFIMDSREFTDNNNSFFQAKLPRISRRKIENAAHFQKKMPRISRRKCRAFLEENAAQSRRKCRACVDPSSAGGPC
jgi:hypothetical protein